jgi:hypothetical protein
MEEQITKQELVDVSSFQEKSFNYQLECLKLEIDLVDREITRMETITQNVKNFSIVTWAAGITVFLGQDTLRKYIIFTAFLPLVFWFVDAWWIHLHIGAKLRLKKIKEFLNSEKLLESFKQQRLVEFTVLDILGRQYKGTKEYELITNVPKIMRYKELLFLYGGLSTFSFVLGVVALFLW